MASGTHLNAFSIFMVLLSLAKEYLQMTFLDNTQFSQGPIIYIFHWWNQNILKELLGPLLLRWFNFNPSMDK